MLPSLGGTYTIFDHSTPLAAQRRYRSTVLLKHRPLTHAGRKEVNPNPNSNPNPNPSPNLSPNPNPDPNPYPNLTLATFPVRLCSFPCSLTVHV